MQHFYRSSLARAAGFKNKADCVESKGRFASEEIQQGTKRSLYLDQGSFRGGAFSMRLSQLCRGICIKTEIAETLQNLRQFLRRTLIQKIVSVACDLLDMSDPAVKGLHIADKSCQKPPDRRAV